jgi:transcriptional regulator with XRE-family HTH domain
MPTPTTRKKQLGYALRYLREQAGLNQAEAAVHVRKPANRIAEIENGQRNIAYGDLVLLLQLYGVADDERVSALTELREGTSQRKRWTGYRAVYPEQFRMFVDLEEDADLIRMVEAEVIPGLLQCESYVRALFADRPTREAAFTTDDLVEARLARQKIFTKSDAPQLMVVMSESSLRRWQGGPEVMKEQLDHLVTMSRWPNVQLQVLPFRTNSDWGSWVGYRYTLLRVPSPGIAGPLELVYIDQVIDTRYLEDKPAVAAHDTLWHQLSGAALGLEDSRAFILDMAREF